MKNVLATDAEVAKYIQQASDWVKAHPIFNDIKFAAVQAVSEYMANRDGRTLYGQSQLSTSEDV